MNSLMPLRSRLDMATLTTKHQMSRTQMRMHALLLHNIQVRFSETAD